MYHGPPPSAFLVLAQLEEACFSMVQLLKHEHKHGCVMWTLSIIMHTTPPSITKRSKECERAVCDQNDTK